MVDLSILRTIAKAKRFTIAELERACSFSQGTIKRWNRTVPGIDNVEKVADILECSLDTLCGRESPEKPHDDQLILGFMDDLRSEREVFSDDERTIIRKFRSLSDADKYSVLMMIMRLESNKED